MVTVLMRKIRPWKLIALALPEVPSTIGGPLPITSLISKVSVSASDSFKTTCKHYMYLLLSCCHFENPLSLVVTESAVRPVHKTMRQT